MLGRPAQPTFLSCDNARKNWGSGCTSATTLTRTKVSTLCSASATALGDALGSSAVAPVDGNAPCVNVACTDAKECALGECDQFEISLKKCLAFAVPI